MQFIISLTTVYPLYAISLELIKDKCKKGPKFKYEYMFLIRLLMP